MLGPTTLHPRSGIFGEAKAVLKDTAENEMFTRFSFSSRSAIAVTQACEFSAYIRGIRH